MLTPIVTPTAEPTVEPTIEPTEYPYTINSLKLISASGEEYGEIPTDTSFIAEIDVTKTAERSGQDYFIVAAYGENNALVSMNYIKADLPTGANFSCGVNIQIRHANSDNQGVRLGRSRHNVAACRNPGIH